MNNMIKIFENEEFGRMRTVIKDGEPWLVGKDVAGILGYSNTRDALSRHVDIEDKTTVVISDSGSNYKSKTTIINESGFYSLVLSSKMPRAKEFKRWVTATILPTLRKTGGYVSNEEMFIENYLPFLDEPYRDLFRLQMTVINQLNDRIRRDEPKVKFADHVSDSVNLIDMNEMAKLCADHGIPMGRTRLFAWLRSKGILMAGNLPYQEYIERGCFKVKESVFDYGGEPKTYRQTLVTGKGQQYILARLMKEFQEGA